MHLTMADPLDVAGAPPVPLSPVQPPVQLTPFVGRERELAAVGELLEASRLLTLTGSGGSGKTRLAVEAAARFGPALPDGVAWVDLGSLPEPMLLARHVADALGLRDADTGGAEAALGEALRGRAMLLVLDNCEHLVDACAVLVEGLLRRCPRLRVLATSREALAIGGERAWLVPALSLPDQEAGDPAAMAAAEAVQLFLERAQAVQPGFSLTAENASAVAQICRTLDGLPLAIELAAARVRVLAPEQIAERLEDSFRLLTTGGRTALPRHRTLREAIDWSYDLLSETEQLLLRRLSVFARGFSLRAAEAVCAGDALAGDEVLDVLGALVDKSLVLMEPGSDGARYRLLETVRQYGRARLQQAGEVDTLRARHGAYFVALAEEAEPHIFGGAADAEWMARLDEETPNLRAAVDWFTESPNRMEGALRIGAALTWFLFARGSFQEARQRLSEALERATKASPHARARGLTALSNVMFWQGDYAGVRAPLEESVATLRELDDRRALAFSLASLGMAATVEGDTATAAAVLDEARELARALGAAREKTFILYWRARAAMAEGRTDLARAALEEAVGLGRKLGYEPGIAHPAAMLGRLLQMQGELPAARLCLNDALRSLHRLRDRWGMIQVLEPLATIDAAEGRSANAARLLAAASALRERIASPRPADERGAHDRLVTDLRDRIGDVAFDELWAEGRRLSYDAVVEIATVEPGGSPAEAEAAAGTAAPPPPPVVPVWSPGPVGLAVRGLGPVEIVVDGRALDGESWSYARPRELLLYLLCHPAGRSRDQIGVDFWPDAAPGQIRNSFHVMLHHLRKTLARAEWILFENERYLVNPSLTVEFDAIIFERELPAALKQEGTAALRSALALYRGEFLADETAGDWHLEHRDRLRRLYVQGMDGLGDRLLEAGETAEATTVFQRILLVDDLAEDSHRQLMIALARQGGRVQALRHYDRLVELLRDELDAEPEEETTALYERLRQAQPV
jgi:predicted ATPase/DNA-binding SARP family transcriptional activator